MKAWYKTPVFWIIVFGLAAAVYVFVGRPDFIFPPEEEVIEALVVEETPRLDELEFRVIRLEVAVCINENVVRQMAGGGIIDLEGCYDEWNGYMLDG